jgi:hypothetical protein
MKARVIAGLAGKCSRIDHQFARSAKPFSALAFPEFIKMIDRPRAVAGAELVGGG